MDHDHLERIEALKDIAKASDNTYGSRRMKAGLNAMGYPVSRNKARKLMKQAGVQVKSRKQCKETTDSNHAKPLFDNILNRDCAPAGPNQAYVQDITYIWTQQGCALPGRSDGSLLKACGWLEQGVQNDRPTSL